MLNTPYRDHDPQASTAFGQHLGIATALLEQFTQIPQRMGGARPDEIRELEQEARATWENLWEQLGQARAIAKSLGHNVDAYDVARAAAGDIWLHAVEVSFGPWERVAGGQRRTVVWKSAPLEPARQAIQALNAAMPQVVISEPPPEDIDLRSGYKRIATYGPLAIIAAAVAYAVLHFVL